jgi:uncharacterized membrane protein
MHDKNLDRIQILSCKDAKRAETNKLRQGQSTNQPRQFPPLAERPDLRHIAFMMWDRLATLMRAEETFEDFNPEPRWPAFIAILAVGGLYAALPDALTMGPRWLFPAIVLAFLIPTIASHHAGRHRLNTIFGFAVDAVLTVGLINSLILLINALPTRQETPQALLLSAACLWITNILVFALWYWRLDAGGPHQRDRRASHANGAFLFPQMTMTEAALKQAGQQDWSPNFVDYLFLAFNTSTALSPTDVPVLTRWGKILMMLQSLLSLLIIALLAARAVNIL